MSRLESLLFAAVVFLLVGVVSIIVIVTDSGRRDAESLEQVTPTVTATPEASEPARRFKIPVRKAMDAKPDDGLGEGNTEIADVQPSELEGGEAPQP